MRRLAPSTIPHASPRPAPVSTRALLGLGGCLLAACFIGILSRPTGFMSSFWPANAVLLGLLLRLPQLAHWKGWTIALGVFVLTDWVTGSALPAALWLSAANLCGVAAGWWFLHRLEPSRLKLQRQSSALYLFLGCAIAATASSLVGAGTGPRFFGTPWQQAAMMWFSAELMNLVLIVPLILSAPRWSGKRRPVLRLSWSGLLPLLSVLVAEYAALLIGGPGAITFSVPGLLWCALVYRPFTIALLSLLVCNWKMVSMSLGVFEFVPANLDTVVSLRLGLTLLSLGPLAVASANMARNALLRQLDHAVKHDSLTQVLARAAFLHQSQRLLQRMQHEHRPTTLLMLDIDHFKQVNDRYGHPAGDALLRAFAQTVHQVLRPQDLLGRIGGEEFALLLPGMDQDMAQQVATRICAAVRAQQVALTDGAVLQATVSIGLASSKDSHAGLDTLLLQADQALYQAKAAGRDSWQVFGPGTPDIPDPGLLD